MGRKHTKFKPIAAQQPPRPVPRVGANVEAIEDAHPTWRTVLLDFEGPWGWEKADGKALKKIHAVLKSYESMKWREIRQKDSCGDIELSDVDAKSADARARLRQLGFSQYETLCKLRIDKKGRVWGIRERHIFQLLWWDPDHTVYPMNIADN